MSKKRKTRKQKEQAKTKIHEFRAQEPQEIVKYSVTRINNEGNKSTATQKASAQTFLSDNNMRKDLVSISAASGIVIAFYVLLATLLFSGTLRLNFLGY